MLRKIIKIDTALCEGCGACVQACHEGAIGMVDGKAALLNESHCDGLGNCLPACPAGAISFEERASGQGEDAAKQEAARHSALRHWPIQLKLVPASAPWFENADLLIAADCAAYAYSRFHGDFMQGKAALIACPKLDGVDYSEKLAQIIGGNTIQSVSVVRMEVPCCGGLEHYALSALSKAGKTLPCRVVTISIKGDIL